MGHCVATSPSHRQDCDLLSPRETARMLGNISDTTLWRMRQRGEFPEPVRISPGRKGYRLADIAAWLDARRQPVEAA